MNAKEPKVPFIRRKPLPGRRAFLQAESTFSKQLYEDKVGSFVRANSTRACSDCLALTELTRLSEPKCLHVEKLIRFGGRPYRHKRVTQLARSVSLLAEPTLFFFSSNRFAAFYNEICEKLTRPG